MAALHTIGLSALLACAGICAAAEPVQVRARGSAHDALYDLAFEGSDGIAVGSFGTVLSSRDGGAHWQHSWQTPGRLALLGVARQGGHCLAVGQQGSIYRADDCQRWQAVTPLTPARLMAVSMNRSGMAVTVGSFGLLALSTDWGAHWTRLTPDWRRLSDDGAEPHLYAVDVRDDGSVTVAGEFGLILRLQGGQWRVTHKGEQTLFGLRLQDNGGGYAVGQGGAVLATSDGGNSWRQLESGSSAILTGVAALPDGRVIASGINTIIASRDNGQHWQPLQAGSIGSAWHQAVAVAQAEQGKLRIVTVGAAGLILEVNH